MSAELTEAEKQRTRAAKLLNSLLIRTVPYSLQSRYPRISNGTYPVDLEIDDGYPSEAAVETIAMVSFRDARRWLRDMFPKLVAELPCASVVVTDVEDWDRPAKQIAFSTGGWSGCESVIGAVLDHPIMRRHLAQENRGGHYVFILPLDQVRDPT